MATLLEETTIASAVFVSRLQRFREAYTGTDAGARASVLIDETVEGMRTIHEHLDSDVDDVIDRLSEAARRPA